MVKLFLFIKKGRVRKKARIYKQLFLLSFDWTIAFYILAFISYIAVVFILEQDLTLFQMDTLEVERFTTTYFLMLVTSIPLIRLLAAFRHPGVLFTSAEYTLQLLPHSLKNIWTYTVVERWLKALVLFGSSGLFFYLFTTLDFAIIFLYVGLLVGIHIVMTVPEWKFFQLSFFSKVAIFIGLLCVNALHAFLPAHVVATLFGIGLVLIHILLLPRVFQRIDWQKVKAAGDFYVWNMVLISYMTKVKFQRERQYSLWQQLRLWKKPFTYRITSAYHRLWLLYLQKQSKAYTQLLLALLAVMFVCLFLKDLLFLIIVAFSFHSFASLLATLFRDRLQSGIVQVLPWDLVQFRKTFLIWALILSAPIMFPIIIFVVYKFSFVTLAQAIVFIWSYVFLLQRTVIERVKYWQRPEHLHPFIMAMNYIALLLVILSHFYAVLIMFAFLLLIIIAILHRKSERALIHKAGDKCIH